MYCPCCQQIYYPSKHRYQLDGAFFGTDFPHVFFQNFPQFLDFKMKKYIPKVYGFKVHESSKVHPGKYEYDYKNNSYKLIPRPVPQFKDYD